MTAISWKTGVNGTWNTASDWSGGAIPTINDDVTIGATGTYTVTIGGNDFAKSLTINDASAKVVDSGTLTLGGALVVTAGTFTLGSGGIINGGTITTGSSGRFLSSGGTLSGVADQGLIDMSAASSSLTLAKSFDGTGGGVINDTGNAAFLYTQDSMTLDNATLNIGNGTGYSYLYVEENLSGTATLTLGSHFNLTETGKNAQINIDPQGYGANALANKGTMTAGTAGGNFTIYGQYAGDSFTNQGTIAISNGDVFNASNIVTFVNSGLITATGAKTVLDIGGGSSAWSNTGSIALSSGATANLGGTFTLAALSRLSNSAGTLNITGTLMNSGTTLTLGTGSAAGTVGLSGEIIGGTIVDAGGGLITQGGTLSGVTYLGTLSLANSTSLYVENGLNVSTNGSAGVINDTGNSAFLDFQDSQTLDNATLNLGGAGYAYIYIEEANTDSNTLTIGAHLDLIAGKNAQINIDPQGYGANTLLNNGTITVGAAGGAFTVYGQYTGDYFINKGMINVSGNETLDLSNVQTFTNSGLVTASGTNTVLNLGNSWSNSGTIALYAGATANLGGSFTLAALSSLSNTAGTLNITGTLTNGGTTLTLGTGSAAGTVGLSGEIVGGTIVDSGGGLAPQSGTLSGVTYLGTLSLANSTTLYIQDGLNVSTNGSFGVINDTGNSAFLDFQDSQTLNNATLNLGSAGTSYLYLEEANTNSNTLTLGAHLNLIAGKNAQINIDPQGYGANTLLNTGTITVGAAGGAFTVYGQNTGDDFINQGTINVSGNETLDLSNVQTFTNAGLVTASGTNTVLNLGNSWSNSGTIALSAGATANLGGSFTLAALSSLSNTAGTLNITGTLTNSGTTLTLGTGSAAGTVGLSGEIVGGTIVDSGGGLVSQGGTLSGVTYQGALTLAGTGGLHLIGANSFTGIGGSGAGTINLVSSGINLVTIDTQTLDNMTLNFGGAGNSNAIYLQSMNSNITTLTLGTHLNLTQSASSSSGTIDLYSNTNAGGILINQGTITAAAKSGNFSIYGGGSTQTTYKIAFTNQGNVIVSNGDTFDISTVATFTNLKAGALTGGSFEVDAGSVLQLAQNAVITTDSSNITLSGANSTIQAVNASSGKQVTIDQKLTSISSTGTLALLANRSLSASAAFTDSGLLQLGGGTFATNGFTLSAGAHLTGFGTLAAPLADSGTVEASGGTLAITGSITGTGALQIDAGATLDIKGSTSASETASFSGQGGVLKLESAAGFSSVIAGYAAGDVINIGTLTATASATSGNTLTVNLTGGSTLVETLSAPVTGEHVGVSADGHSLTAYRFAIASIHTPEPVAFGNHHVGDTVTTALSLSNTATADGYSEKLDASLYGASSGLSAIGSITGLAAGATDGTDLVVGLNTSAAGSISGTATIGLSTDGTGIDQSGATALGSQTVNVTGAVYAYAAASAANGGTVALGNVHVGSSALGTLALSNAAAANGYAEALDASLGGASMGFTASGSFTGLAAGATNSGSLAVGLTAGAAGALSGTATLTLTSDGNGNDGLGTTALGTQTVTITGAAYGYAAAQLASTGINLGVVHVGDVAQTALSLGNSAAANGYDEALDATFGSLTGNATAGGSVSLLSAGATDTSHLLIGLATGTSGTISGTAVLNLLSDGTGLDGLGTTSLGSQKVNVTGIVDNYALAAFADGSGPAISGSGTQYTLNLGTVVQGGSALTVSLGALNAATGLADLLGGTITTTGGTGFTNTGFGTFSGLGAGQNELGQSISLATSSAGTFTEVLVLTSAGSNASGYTGALATETLTVTGTVNNTSGSTTYTLASGPNVLTGTSGGDVFIATAGSLNSRDQITGGNGPNVMQLTGGGVFDLGAPKIFINIPVINAVEGQAAQKNAPDTRQTVYLRDGSNETLNVAAGTAATGNSSAESITIYGGTGNDTINLASGIDSVVLYTGTDTVVLGGAKNTVTAGGGTALVQASAAQATAAVIGNASSNTTLEITGAGTIKLSALDTYLTVKLDGATKLTLGNMGFITADGSNGGDTLTAGGANQTLIGGTNDVLTGYTSGSDTFLGASSLLNGDTIANWTTGDVIDITDMNSTSLKALTFKSGKLTVSDGTHSDSLAVKGLSGSTLTLQNFSVLGSDGHGGTLIGWHT